MSPLADLRRDDAPGEQRIAVIEAGHVVELHLYRAGQSMPGEVGTGRLTAKQTGRNFLMSADGQTILLHGQVEGTEGASIRYCIIRAECAEPGQVKCAEAVVADADASDVSAAQSWAAFISAHSPAALANAIAKADLSPIIDAAVLGVVATGDTRISFERTKAGLVFDVDGNGDTHAINIAAAAEIGRLLRLYQVAGSVMIDFISSRNKDERLAIGAAFDAAAASDPRPFERSAVNGFGLMQVVRAKSRPSVLDMLFGTQVNQLSDETQALALLRDAGRSTGIGSRMITASPAIATLLATSLYAPLLDRISTRLGVPITVVADASVTGYGHVHVAQR